MKFCTVFPRVTRHFGPRTLRPQDTSAPNIGAEVSWGRSVRITCLMYVKMRNVQNRVQILFPWLTFVRFRGVLSFPSILINRWNKLRQETISATSINSFKQHLDIERSTKMDLFLDSPLGPRPTSKSWPNRYETGMKYCRKV